MKHLIVLFIGLIPWVLHAKSMALVTVSIGSEYYEATKTGILSKEAYCKKHGYDFICIRESIDPSRPPAWQKILALKALLSKYDWIFWSDADALIMNSEIPLESLIDERVSLVISHDNNSNTINSGHFLLKNSDWSFEFLENVYGKVQYINHVWWEQAAIIDVLGQIENLGSYVKIIEQRRMNAFPRECFADFTGTKATETWFQPGDFIVHFAGLRTPALLEKMMTEYHANCD